MKLSVAVAGKDALPSAFVVWRGFESSIRKAREYGYDGVELALRSASDIRTSELDRYLSDNDMEVSCVSTGQVFAADHLYFTHPEKAVRDRCIAVFEELIDLASCYCRLVNVGRVRGFIEEGKDEIFASSLFCETASPICEYAAKKGVDIIIEPVNRYEINFVNSTEQGVRLLKQLGYANAGLMPDVFHMNIEDARIGDALVKCGEYLKYIHLADSNRLAPGQGHLDFDEVFSALTMIGYDGWASVEIFPVPTPDIAAKQAADYLIPRIRNFYKGKK